MSAVGAAVRTQPIFLAGRFVEAGEPLDVRSPFDGELVGRTFHAGDAELEEATRAAVAAFERTRKLGAHERSEVLRHVAERIGQDADELAALVAREAGKPIRDARAEVDRAQLTFRTAAEEALRITGEWLPLDWNAANAGRAGILRRYPIGPVAAISPFNFPLNLAAHKIAPAIAAGCSIVLKPPSKDPLGMLRVAAYLAETELPAGAVSVLPMSRSTGERMAADERFRLLSFTGSPAVGWHLHARAGRKRVLLELGGNAAAIVDEGADLDWAVERLAYGSFTFAGQSCISVQRIYVLDPLYEEFEERFVAAVRRLRLGDPLDTETEVGPMIDRAALDRTDTWVREAVAGGAVALTGGVRRDPFYEPTVLTNVAPGARVLIEEAFAPVVSLAGVGTLQEALERVNDSRYGLQAGVFTGSLESALVAHDELDVGSVVVNDVPTWRIDPMPYGGTKESGLGREGLRWAIEEMTEPRLLAIARPPRRPPATSS